MAYIVTDAGNIPFKGLAYTSFAEYGTGGYRLVVEKEIVNPENFFDWSTTPIWMDTTKQKKVTLSNGNYFSYGSTGGNFVNIKCYNSNGIEIDGIYVNVEGSRSPWIGKGAIFPFADANGVTYISGVLQYNRDGFYNAPRESFINNWAMGEGFPLSQYASQTEAWTNFLKGSVQEEETDPFGPGGSSGTGGGGGSFDNTSTPIEIPNLPSISASSTGFISLFNPTLNQLNELASYLWSDLFEVNGWKKLFANPMDAILGLSIVPVAVPSGGTREVKVGNIGTGISLTIASSQFVEVDCGSIDVNEYWGAYLDYEPYTQAQIFLPYIGTRPISVDEIMGKTVRVVYHVDILTGACCCFVKCGDSVLYTYNGQCSIPIPITGANYASVVNGMLSIAASTAALVATGGQAAPLIAAGSASGATKAAVAKGAAAKAQLTNAQIETGSNVASNVANQMKPQIAKSGSISGGAGLLNMQTPYLILIRPRQALPSKQNEFIGYPSLITVQLSELNGYTEVQSIHLENIPATSQELDEIEGLLKGGVIF